jgi:dipeptidyl-peptidase-4
MVARAGDLTVPTLLIHGLADDNVLPSHSLAYYRAGFATTAAVELVALPGMTHFPAETDMALALVGREVAFLRRHLIDRNDR